ncbi:hypothetical protein FQN57_001205 [Myotisia sp. PD_48]|nr:hypothetical protein FQN57_001205 [Myotisia sp. PD_48]
MDISPDQQKNAPNTPNVDDPKDSYYRGEVKWTKITKLSLESELEKSPYKPKADRYLSSLRGVLPTVPERLPYSTISSRADPVKPEWPRVNATTYMLTLKNGSFLEEEGTEVIKLYAGIDIDGSLGAEGQYGSLSFSAGMKANAGMEWSREIKTHYKDKDTIDKTKLYQPSTIHAKLKCKIIGAYTTSFEAVTSIWGITLNPEGTGPTDAYRLENQSAKISAGVPYTTSAPAGELFASRQAFNSPTWYDGGIPVITTVHIGVLPRYDDGKCLVWEKITDLYFKLPPEDYFVILVAPFMPTI